MILELIATIVLWSVVILNSALVLLVSGLFFFHNRAKDKYSRYLSGSYDLPGPESCKRFIDHFQEKKNSFHHYIFNRGLPAVVLGLVFIYTIGKL